MSDKTIRGIGLPSPDAKKGSVVAVRPDTAPPPPPQPKAKPSADSSKEQNGK